jgi:hypothetical protein
MAGRLESALCLRAEHDRRSRHPGAADKNAALAQCAMITVTNLTPGSSAQVSSEETVSAIGKASSAGTATITLLAPAGLPRGRSIEAHLITVEGTDATGRPASETAAFLLAKRSVCQLLRRRR